MVSAPATKPAGSNTMIAGMRMRLDRTWDPTASVRIKPTPIRIWLVVMPASEKAGTTNNCQPFIYGYGRSSTDYLPLSKVDAAEAVIITCLG